MKEEYYIEFFGYNSPENKNKNVHCEDFTFESEGLQFIETELKPKIEEVKAKHNVCFLAVCVYDPDNDNFLKAFEC